MCVFAAIVTWSFETVKTCVEDGLNGLTLNRFNEQLAVLCQQRAGGIIPGRIPRSPLTERARTYFASPVHTTRSRETTSTFRAMIT